jgi:arginase family enzyme
MVPKYALVEAASALGHVPEHRGVERAPGNGLTGDELTVTLRTAIASGRAVSLQLAICNPDFDPTGSNGRALASTVRNALLP